MFGQHKGIKPSHWIPIASSHVVQTRIWIVIYIKYQHPGMLFTSNTIFSSLTFHLHKAGRHTGMLVNTKISFHIFEGCQSLHFWDEDSVSLLAGVGNVFALPAHSYRVSTVKWKKSPEALKCVAAPSAQGWHGSPSGSWACCCSQVVQMYFGLELKRKGATGRRAGVSASVLPHVSGSWYPQGSTQVSRERSQLHFGLCQQDPFLKGKEKCSVLPFRWKYLFSWPQWNKNYIHHTLSQLLSNWAGDSNCPVFFKFGMDFDFIVCFMTTH